MEIYDTELTNKAEANDQDAELMESATSLARTGNFESASNNLKEGNLLDTVLEKAKMHVSEMGTNLDFLGKAGWEAVSVIFAYDKETFEHSVRARILTEKVLNMEVDGRTLIVDVENELGGLDKLLTAATLHDIGKVNIPYFVLSDTTSSAVWMAELFDMIQSGECEDNNTCSTLMESGKYTKESFETQELLDNHLDSIHARAMQYVPVKKVLEPEQVSRLVAMGFSADATLADIMRLHERYSEEILLDLGVNEKIAKICGSHHNYENKEIELPVSGTILNASVDMGTVLHCLDVVDAIVSSRHYKKPRSIMTAFVGLIGDIRKTHLHGDTVYFIIKGLYAEVDEDEKSNSRHKDVIENFLNNPEMFMNVTSRD